VGTKTGPTGSRTKTWPAPRSDRNSVTFSAVADRPAPGWRAVVASSSAFFGGCLRTTLRCRSSSVGLGGGTLEPSESTGKVVCCLIVLVVQLRTRGKSAACCSDFVVNRGSSRRQSPPLRLAGISIVGFDAASTASQGICQRDRGRVTCSWSKRHAVEANANVQRTRPHRWRGGRELGGDGSKPRQDVPAIHSPIRTAGRTGVSLRGDSGCDRSAPG